MLYYIICNPQLSTLASTPTGRCVRITAPAVRRRAQGLEARPRCSKMSSPASDGRPARLPHTTLTYAYPSRLKPPRSWRFHRIQHRQQIHRF